jgi:hypothetical protein
LFNQVNKPKLAVELDVRELSPAATTPTFEPMRPDTSSNPTVELVEEFSNVAGLVILASTLQNWIQFSNQLSGAQGHDTLGPLPHLILETTNRLLAGIRVQRRRANLATHNARRQPEGYPALDLITQGL